MVDFKKMMMATSIQAEALAQLLIEKGIITEQEYFVKLREVMAEYNSKTSNLLDDNNIR